MVGVVGLGYVGLTTAFSLAYLGYRVVGMDVDGSKVRLLRDGKLPFFEPYMDEMFSLVEERVSFATRYEEAIPEADVVFITVGTPQGTGGAPMLDQVKGAAEGIGRNLKQDFVVVVNKSTVPVGSGNYVEALVRRAYAEVHGGNPDGRFVVASNPEFLREGQALRDSLYPDRIVVGADDVRAIEILRVLYQPILEQDFIPPPFLPRPEKMGGVPFVTADLASAEMIKYAANAFLALKISFINELAGLAEKVGADIRIIARGIGLDARIGPRFLQAGLGWGGSCFPKDTAALLAMGKEYGVNLEIISAAREVNFRQ
ncbi:UDP-glucose/GDP-mannose dehydrogenase family protein, partial [Candidatus Parcubacteria bacterium]